jgi:nitroreductase
MVAQNVYLFCAAEGLGTCLVGGVDADAIRAALSLEPGVAVTFVQPLGWPG